MYKELYSKEILIYIVMGSREHMKARRMMGEMRDHGGTFLVLGTILGPHQE